MAFVLCSRWACCAVDWFVVSGGPWLHLRSSLEWIVRCWGGLLPAGRNVRVSMMVECFGIYTFFWNVSWYWVYMELIYIS